MAAVALIRIVYSHSPPPSPCLSCRALIFYYPGRFVVRRMLHVEMMGGRRAAWRWLVIDRGFAQDHERALT